MMQEILVYINFIWGEMKPLREEKIRDVQITPKAPKLEISVLPL